MSVEFRPARQEEMERFNYVASTALVTNVDNTNVQPEFTYCAFEDGNLATSYAEWPLTMRFNGEGVPIAGVTMVGTLPVYRRRGYLRQIMIDRFKFLYEQGERPIALLYASRAAIYQRYGYAVVSTNHSYRFDPMYLQFSTPQDVPGTFRELSDDEFPLLVELYRSFRADRTGYMHRPRAMWDAGTLNPPPTGGQLRKVVYEEAGKPLGYLIYIMESPPGSDGLGPVQRLTIRDLVWLTPAAYRAVWHFIAKMDLVNSVVWGRAPGDDPLPHLILEPRVLRKISSDGLLARIIDVNRALPQRCYDEEGTLTFEIIDDLCPWNKGRWQLKATTSGSSVAPYRKKPQLIMPVSTLAMVVFGQLSASEAARMGRLDVKDEKALPLWNRVMRTRYQPACADMF